MTITSIADELYRELEGATDISIPSISFWLQSNIGKLNNVIGTNFVIVNGDTDTPLTEQQKVILKILYNISYFQRQVNKNLGAAAYISVMEVTEGNRTVRRANKTEVAKAYGTLVRDLQDALDGQIQNYKMNAAVPQQFIVPNPILTELGAFVVSPFGISRISPTLQ